jgi:hypothetical protein
LLYLYIISTRTDEEEEVEKEPVREDKGKGKAAMYEEEEYAALSQVLEFLALMVEFLTLTSTQGPKLTQKRHEAASQIISSLDLLVPKYQN